jgi:hypothetical protein
VNQESAQELLCGDRHDLLLAAVRIVFPAKRDPIILERNQSMVGDGDAVRIASEIVQNMLGTAEGWLGIDDPVLAKELSEKSSKATRLDKTLERAVKLELVLTKELFQSSCELAAEDAAQCGDGQEESSRGGDPSGTVRCKTASRNNVMDVRMMLKVLPPSVEHAEKPDVCSQMLWVCGQFKQRRCTGSEQQIVKQSLVLQG